MSISFIILYLNRNFLYFSFQSDPQYGDFAYYDSHPYPLGWPDMEYSAYSMCSTYNARLCSDKELLNLANNQKRSFCDSSWAYDSKNNMIRGYLTNIDKKLCFQLADGYPEAPTGLFPEMFSSQNAILTYVCIYDFSVIKKNYECTGNGADYAGFKSVTKSGIICQRWDFQTPNKHEDTPTNPDFRNLQGNYCRNYDYSLRPWCYLSTKEGKEDCDIECSLVGEYDSCAITIYDQPNFFGNNCTISAEKSKITDVQLNNKNHCGDKFNKRLRSFKVSGSYCIVVLYGEKGDKMTFRGNVMNNDTASTIYFQNNIVSITTVDASASVILGDFNYYHKYINILPDVHICEPFEIDGATYITKFDENYPDFGYAMHNKVIIMYSNAKVFPSDKKKAWCCLNEHPEKQGKTFSKNAAYNACSKQTRKESFEIEGQMIIYTHLRRICTVNDMKAHFEAHNLIFSKGWVAESPDSVVLAESNVPGIILITTANDDLSEFDVWCCDEDCLPINFDCNEDKACCTLNCINNLCTDPDAIEVFGQVNKEYEAEIPDWLRWLIFIAFLYIFGCLMRCCCPKRRRINRYVKIV